MAVTIADVRALAPELAAVPDATIAIWLGWAPRAVSASAFGADFDQAVTLWTAHQALKASPGASTAAGTATGRDVGDVRGQNAAPSAAQSDSSMLKTTAYGVELMRLIRRHCSGPAVV